MSTHIIETRGEISMADKTLNIFVRRKSLKGFETDFSFHIMLNNKVTTTSDITLNHCDCK